MDREKKRGKMKIRSWTCRGYRGYQDAVHPELHKMLLSLGGNSIFAELAITETVRLLTERQTQTEESLSVRAFIIASDFRITIRAERSSFPIGVARRYMQRFGKKERSEWEKSLMSGRFLPARTIRRILSPIEYVILAVDGREVSLLFRFPFTRTETCDIDGLVQKIHWEEDDVIDS